MPYVRNLDLLKGSRDWESFTRLDKENTLAVVYKDGSKAIRYYYTDIITYRLDGSVVLNSDGWSTPTTKDRINYYLNNKQFIGAGSYGGVYITQSNNRWFIDDYGKKSLFYDGVVLDHAGYVVRPVYIDKRRDRLLKYIEK